MGKTQSIFVHKTSGSFMLNESLLIKRLKAGDNIAFQELINEFEPRLSRAAKVLGSNKQETEELVSDTFAAVFFGIKRFKQKSSLFSWLYGILLNKFYYRLGRRKREIALEVSLSYFIKAMTTPDREKESLVLFQQYLPGLLSKIPQDQQEVILLKYLEGMQVKEIAKSLNIPESTINDRLYRARNNLRKILKNKKFLPNSFTY